jgi:hypothetical protein
LVKRILHRPKGIDISSLLKICSLRDIRNIFSSAFNLKIATSSIVGFRGKLTQEALKNSKRADLSTQMG